MSKTIRWYGWFMVCGVCFLASGCVDAVRDGITAGVSGGLTSLIESCIASIADLAFGTA